MRELSKAVSRWNRDSRYATRYFLGKGIDIGCGPDPLTLYASFFPGIEDCQPWDLQWGSGDARTMEGVADSSFDFVVSSHCLEHLTSPVEALHHWMRITKPGGHLVIIVPDEDRYEQGVWPSTFNSDHKFTFTAFKGTRSWSPSSRNVLTLIQGMADAELLKLEVLDSAHRYDLPRCDQTLTIGESAIELVLRKRTKAELDAGGRLPPPGELTPEGLSLILGMG